jgi:hypothetical protein
VAVADGVPVSPSGITPLGWVWQWQWQWQWGWQWLGVAVEKNERKRSSIEGDSGVFVLGGGCVAVWLAVAAWQWRGGSGGVAVAVAVWLAVAVWQRRKNERNRSSIK